MDFHEVQFPVALSFGSLGGPHRRTEVVSLTNGFEERNTSWAHSRRVYDAGIGLRSMDDVQEVMAFFEARYGQMYGFRWKDWSDYKSGKSSAPIAAEDQIIAVGDGVQKEFQIIKTYQSGGHGYARPITKPLAETVLVSVEQDPQEVNVDYVVDGTTGIITFTHPPDPDTRVLAGYEFDVPARFDADRIVVSAASFHAGEVPDIPVIEVRV